MPITEFLEKNARFSGKEIALVEINPEEKGIEKKSWSEYNLIESGARNVGKRQITWKQFDEVANRTANALLNQGIKKGCKVGILLMNCIEWLPVYFGILKTGAIAVPLNFRYSSDEITYCMHLADTDALFFGPEFINRIDIKQINGHRKNHQIMIFLGPVNETPSFAMNFFDITAKVNMMAPEIELKDDDYAAIYFSSGTTGFPKAILHKHTSLMHAARTEQAHHGQTKDDVFLCIPPLYHTGAKMHWFGSLISCSKAVLLKGTKPKYILDAVSSEKCTIVWLLVPWAQDILTALESGELKLEDYPNLSQWRLMHIGAQPVPQSLIHKWFEYFPNHQYDTNYGLSESIGPGCVHLGIGNNDKVGAIGKAGYGWQTKIIDPEGQEVTRGEVGELCVKGPGVMTRYYRDPKSTKAVLKNGWLRTGDMAKEDEDGFIYLVDRKKDVIITGGENLYPVQIEDFLHNFPKIQDVAVIGLPDKRLGEIAAAIIQLKPGAQCTEDEINEFCLQIPRYKRPKKIIFADVPRNPTGKIEKPKLRQIYGSEKLVEMQNES